MTKKELIKAMDGMNEDSVVTLHLGEGWSNIEMVNESWCAIEIHAEQNPVFSES